MSGVRRGRSIWRRRSGWTRCGGRPRGLGRGRGGGAGGWPADELPTVQARLGMQAARLLDAAAGRVLRRRCCSRARRSCIAAAEAVAGGPAVALAALRQAGANVDVADGALARLDDEGSGRRRCATCWCTGRWRLAALLVQLACRGLAGRRRAGVLRRGVRADPRRRWRSAAAGCWSASSTRSRPRTAAVGAFACIAPALLAVLLLAVLLSEAPVRPWSRRTGAGGASGQRGLISAIASARVFASGWRMPRTAEVTVRAPAFRMPRIAMHMCSHSSTTMTPRGVELAPSAGRRSAR